MELNVIDQHATIIAHDEDILSRIEDAARTCYKSENKTGEEGRDRLIRNLIRNDHHAMLEFGDVTVRMVTDRGVSHEMVRHRPCSFAQESTRYVSYAKHDFVFIRPVWFTWYAESDSWDMDDPFVRQNMPPDEYQWLALMTVIAKQYKQLIDGPFKWKPEEARSILPVSIRTELVVRANIREWRHIFKLRCASTAHPQMRSLMRNLYGKFHNRWPLLFPENFNDL